MSTPLPSSSLWTLRSTSILTFVEVGLYDSFRIGIGFRRIETQFFRGP